jgi:hypothetical protein
MNVTRADVVALLAMLVGLSAGCGGERRPEEIRRLALSADGATTAHVVRRADGEVVVQDGQTVAGPFDRVAHLAFAPDGALTYVARKGQECTVVRGGGPVGGPYEWAGDPAFGSEGRGLAFRATKGGATFVVSGGSRYGEGSDTVGPPALSPAGDEVAFAVQSGNGTIRDSHLLFLPSLPPLRAADGERTHAPRERSRTCSGRFVAWPDATPSRASSQAEMGDCPNAQALPLRFLSVFRAHVRTSGIC